jgi:hypothetical protein
VLLVEEYSEITELLTELVNRYKRRTVFIATSAFNFDPWGSAAVMQFAQELGRVLVADGTRIATGLGAGIGDAIFTGALREVMRTKGMNIEDALVLRRRPCLSAFLLPFGAPGDRPPCIRQRPLGIAGDWHGLLLRV